MQDRDITDDAFESVGYLPITTPISTTTGKSKSLNAEGDKEVYISVGHADNPLCGDWFKSRSVDTDMSEAGELLTIPDDKIGNDSFSPATTQVKKAVMSDVQRVIKKLTDMYVVDPLNKSADIWGFAECWGEDNNGKPVLVGVKVLSRSYYSKYELPEVFEGYKLYFSQAGMDVPADMNRNAFKGVKRGTNLRLW